MSSATPWTRKHTVALLVILALGTAFASTLASSEKTFVLVIPHWFAENAPRADGVVTIAATEVVDGGATVTIGEVLYSSGLWEPGEPDLPTDPVPDPVEFTLEPGQVLALGDAEWALAVEPGDAIALFHQPFSEDLPWTGVHFREENGEIRIFGYDLAEADSELINAAIRDAGLPTTITTVADWIAAGNDAHPVGRAYAAARVKAKLAAQGPSWDELPADKRGLDPEYSPEHIREQLLDAVVAIHDVGTYDPEGNPAIRIISDTGVGMSALLGIGSGSNALFFIPGEQVRVELVEYVNDQAVGEPIVVATFVPSPERFIDITTDGTAAGTTVELHTEAEAREFQANMDR